MTASPSSLPGAREAEGGPLVREEDGRGGHGLEVGDGVRARLCANRFIRSADIRVQRQYRRAAIHSVDAERRYADITRWLLRSGLGARWENGSTLI